MISIYRKFPFLIVFAFFFTGTGCKTDHQKSGEELAKSYCSACHAYPDPSLLDKSSWTDNVLPAMSARMGIRLYMGEAYEQQTKNGLSSFISAEDWKKLAAFYDSVAPVTMPKQERATISDFTSLFEVSTPHVPEKFVPSSIYIHIDTSNHWIYAGSAIDSSLLIFDKQLMLIGHLPLHGILVDMDFDNGSRIKGERSGVLTNIGLINPNDLRTGSCDSFKIDKEGKLLYLRKFIDSLPRPVQTRKLDLDNDKAIDFLICGFGNQRGFLSWMKPLPGGGFKENVLLPLPGAIKTYIDDYNHDGLPDIWALMAQAREGIYLFTNKGAGRFEEKMILEFPAVYGSSYFEFDDFNGDGKKDILYTCGDNADFTSNRLKNFHGAYIFLNNGNNEFKQAFFFPIHGCYKAIARDFDGDGDLDIATISFFPDEKNQPQEGFVYLENQGNFKFHPSTIKEFDAGKWLTMDAGDVDGDGDEDIVIGSLSPQSEMYPGGEGKKYKDIFLLLRNKTK